MNSNTMSTRHEESSVNIHCEDRHNAQIHLHVDSRIWRLGLWRFSFRVFSSGRRWGEDISSWKMQVFDEVKLIFAEGVTCDAGCVRIERMRQGPWQAQTCHYSMRSDVICLTSCSPALSPNFFQMRVLYDEWWMLWWYKIRQSHWKICILIQMNHCCHCSFSMMIPSFVRDSRMLLWKCREYMVHHGRMASCFGRPTLSASTFLEFHPLC